ncbi:hypothetical protein ESY86_04630 [Subsaximicrobium wynnwilliamsii]|jgi:hypothetical protein|uniref:DUF4412 domain-containing protein n=1 Tax=Subsaximicrobium wynnwilliamsii TaxID=291179 RepID=A0A5C6ZKD0_9FLAO|nr:hypothetical protein [Subsaximicrobium wynnwilliamsii]TXD84364.1 hypothetical protein ESY87_04410 [Subsaximicrobium wynnwilliamsii]TXD90045.1 hypothetical protein ESY86_04630 [Subsaximicrobium wynnwilliamsii]TXE04097.1 hypothetical protein ESY88_04405 [Subsaximicrobium wynnwilliamsii]
MKKLILALLALNLCYASFGQDSFEEGKVISKQTMTSDNEQAKAQLAMIGDVETTSYFKGNKTRAEATSPMTGKVISIIDGDSNKMLMLMDSPSMGKVYMLQDISLSEADKKNMEIKKGDETKSILGYECQQYFVTMTKDGQTMKMEMFTTDAISAMSQQTATFNDKISGFPMYMSMDVNQMGMNMTITNEVTSIDEEKVDSGIFDLTPPEGYKDMQPK